MVLRWFLVYVVVDLAALVALTWAVGLGWTVFLLLATFAGGIALAGSQVKRQISRLRSGLADPRVALSDSALIALGTLLVVIPGIVSTAVGLLVLMPLTRALARPVLAVLAARRLARQVPYIDGEVVSVVSVVGVEPAALPRPR